MGTTILVGIEMIIEEIETKEKKLLGLVYWTWFNGEN